MTDAPLAQIIWSLAGLLYCTIAIVTFVLMLSVVSTWRGFVRCLVFALLWPMILKYGARTPSPEPK